MEKRFGYPLFVKPANLGSSVGISKAHDREELAARARPCRGVSTARSSSNGPSSGARSSARCSATTIPKASLPGEIVPANEFYDYDAKYIDENSRLLIPAPLTAEQAREVQRLAVGAFRAVECCGLARVDSFLEDQTGKVLLNEINTMPGFTSISMYPKMWEASGLSYTELIDRLIELALERQAEKKAIRYEF